MTTSFATLVRCLVLTGVVLSTSVAQAAFTSYVIREGGGSAPAIIDRDDVTPGAKEFVIAVGGQKAAMGTNDVNGATIASLTNMAITRYDDTTRFAAGSGPAVAPYFNIWVTNGLGQYAVIANEPSNPDFFSLFQTIAPNTKQYSFGFDDIADKAVKVYETPGADSDSSWVHAITGPGPLTFADVADLTIAIPDAMYINDLANAVGTGAPVRLSDDQAFGFSWVFGDSLTNYVSGDSGYIVGNPNAVPEPSTIALLGLAGLAGLAMVRRRRQA